MKTNTDMEVNNNNRANNNNSNIKKKKRRGPRSAFQRPQCFNDKYRFTGEVLVR